ncbi:glutathione S-transferase family protein [Pannonibacter carbonis]|uniref:glutathione S-transferase family protein n=1 Tax=Pannonibacter carbonis TaxID=2067569 RepID=UPI000D0F4ABC|nr:glutathione S-transferase family protein [Pannonibacter carbonis]
MDGITLYGALNSGHSFKVRLLLLMAGVPHHYVAIDISQPRDARPADFRSVSPFGEVPVLVQNGQNLAQSNALLLHLSRQTGVLGAEDEAGWTAITSWLFWEANRIGRSYPNLRWYRRFDDSGDPALVRWFEETARVDLDRMERELASRAFLLGHPTIADLSLGAYLLYGDDVGLDMNAWPAVMAWLDRIRALPGYRPPLDIMG